MQKDNLKVYIKKLKQLPTISPVAVKIIEIAEKEKVSMKEITNLIVSDQALASKILRVANYALFSSGREGEVNTVERAAALLGLNMVHSVALSFVVVDLFKTTSLSGEFNLDEFWRHSGACAIASELFAQRFSYEHPEEAFIAGLLHDMGKLIFCQWKQDEYNSVVRDAKVVKSRLLEFEEKSFGMGHTQAAKLLMDYWNFPKSLIKSVWQHHQPLAEFGDKRLNELPFIVKCADSLCHIQRFGDSGNPVGDLDANQLKRVTGMSASDMEKISSEALSRYEEVAKIYDWKARMPDLYLSAISRANQDLLNLRLELRTTSHKLTLQQLSDKLIKELREALAFQMTMDEALEKTLNLLGEEVPFKRIMGFIPSKRENLIVGWLKIHDDNSMDRIEMPLDPDTAERLNNMQLREHVALIGKAAGELGDNSPIGKRIIETLRRPALVVLPMSLGENVIGQIMIEPAPFSWSEQEKRDFLRQYTDTAAMLLERSVFVEEVNQQADELSQMARKMEELKTRLYQTERLASVGRLAAGAAHEINNPLAAISLKAQLMQSQATDDKDAEYGKFVFEQITRISKIVKDLMGLSRPAEPKIAPANVAAIIERTLSLVENRIILSGVKIEKTFDREIPLINADANQLEQVFLNLTINAIQAMADGGVLKINLGVVDNESHEVKIDFSDTGIGIAPEKLESIFTPFYTSKSEGGGSGLGLAVCHSIIESHNGKIEVSSNPGKGSTFTILLPLDDRPAADETDQKADEERVKPIERDLQTNSILVVDDDKAIRELLFEALTAEGYKVDIAADGNNGINKIRKTNYNASIINLCMPEKEGIEVLKTVKKICAEPPKIIVISGVVNDKEFEAAKNAGAFECIKKPFKIKDLLASINRAVKA